MAARMADALILLHNTFGVHQHDQALNVQLKRSEIGALSNMTASNASRVLADFAKSNWIDIDHRKIWIRQIDKLKHISTLG